MWEDLGQIGSFGEDQLTGVMIGLFVRCLSFVADFEDFGVEDGLVEASHDELVTQHRTRTLHVRLTHGVTDPLGGRSLLLAFDFTDGLHQPLLPHRLARGPRICIAPLPHSPL